MILGACKWLSRRFGCQGVGFEAIFGANGVALRQYLVPFWWIGGVGVLVELVEWLSDGVMEWWSDGVRDFQHARPLRGSADMIPARGPQTMFQAFYGY